MNKQKLIEELNKLDGNPEVVFGDTYSGDTFDINLVCEDNGRIVVSNCRPEKDWYNGM